MATSSRVMQIYNLRCRYILHTPSQNVQTLTQSRNTSTLRAIYPRHKYATKIISRNTYPSFIQIKGGISCYISSTEYRRIYAIARDLKITAYGK